VSVLGGLFLVAHGLVHLAIWLPEPKAEAPFDPGHSWLLGAVRRPARALAVMAGALLALAGVLVVAGADAGAALAVAGAVVSLALVLLTFHPWLLGAVAIDVAIAVVALT
jgi:hypothetical protein